MNRAILAAALAVMVATAAPSLGQTGAPRPDEGQAVVLNWFARCVVDRWRRSVVQVLEQVPGTPQERQRLSGAIGDWGFCLEPLSAEHTRLVFQGDVMRGPLAEALYEHDFGGGERRSASFADLPDPVELARRRGAPDPVRNAGVVGVFATCVVYARTGDVTALLATRPGSREELAAINSLQADFGNCFPTGAQFDITIPLLRGYLAEALYRTAALRAAADGARQ